MAFHWEASSLLGRVQTAVVIALVKMSPALSVAKMHNLVTNLSF
jgi:hypothetical protein